MINKKMAGITLMIIGIISLGAGIYLYSKPTGESIPAEIAANNTNVKQHLEKEIEMAIADGVFSPNERERIKASAIEAGEDADQTISEVEARLAAYGGKSETEIIDYNKRNGDDFEKYVVQLFDKKYYKVMEWAGDKYVNGTYAPTTLQPDLLMELKLENSSANFAVECKWRKELKNYGLNVATPEQLERYKAFGEMQKIPVFMAIGLGGEGESPEQLFIMPLQVISNCFIPIQTLAKYKKNYGKLYFEMKSGELR